MVFLTRGNLNSFGYNKIIHFLWNMAAKRKFISQTELEELLKNFIDNLSDDSVNEYSSDYDDSK